MQRACAPLRSLSLGRRRSTRPSEVRPPRRASGTRSMRYARALPEREAALLATQDHAPTCQPWPSLRVMWVARAARACAPLRSLSLGRRRSTRASEVRAPRRTGGTRSVRYARALPERKAELLGAQGHAPTCQPWPSLRVMWIARAVRLHATALALYGKEAQHARFRRVRAAPRWRHSHFAPWNGTA